MEVKNNVSVASIEHKPVPPFRNRSFIIAVLALSILLIGGISLFLLNNSSKDDPNPIEIALVVGLTGSQREATKQIKEALDFKLNEVNRNGGINGHQVKLVLYDDKSDAKEAVVQAQKVVSSRAVLALGHYASSTSVPASPVYKEAGMPIITGYATTEAVNADNPYYFRTVGVNGNESKVITAYIQQILKIQTATIIYDDSIFGMSIQEGLKNEFKDQVKNIYKLETDPAKLDDSVKTVVKALAADPNPGVVCLSVLDTTSLSFLFEAKRAGVKAVFFGTDFQGSQQFAEDFKKYAAEKGEPGMSTDGLYALAPIMFDSGRLATQNLAAEYLKTYGRPMDWAGIKFYEALLVGLETIKTANIQNNPQSIKQDRQNIRDNLAAMDSPLKGAPGLEGPIFFNKDRNSTQPFKVGRFTGGKFISAPVQLQVVNNLSLVNVEDEIKNGRMIKLGDQYVWLQRVVYTGLDVNQVSRIDVSKSTFTADVYFWLRYYGDDSVNQIEFIDSPDFNSSLKTPISSEVIDGLNYRLYRLRGDVKVNYDLHNYPFDKQTLNLRFRSTQLNNEQLVYVVDTFGLKLAGTDQSKATKALANLQTWRFLGLQYAVESFDSSSTRGDPRLFSTDATIEFSGLNTVINVERNYSVFLIKSLLPLALLTIILYASLYFPPSLLKEQATVPVTGTLTGVVLLNSINGQLTDVGYTVAIEYLFYIYFAICLTCIVVAVVADRMEASQQKNRANRIRVSFRILYPIIIIAIIAFYWVSYIT